MTRLTHTTTSDAASRARMVDQPSIYVSVSRAHDGTPIVGMEHRRPTTSRRG
jgi:hypothetical protein